MDFNSKHIILVGFMGSGKTRIGKKLAKDLKLNFLDTDAMIEKEMGLSISSIFEQHGEAYFRALESKIILDLLDAPTSVVATGGGLPCSNENLRKLKEFGLLIYLKRPAKELAKRLQTAKKQRPLIAQLNESELIDFVSEKLVEREKYYAQAEISLERNQQKISDILEILAQHIPTLNQ